MPFRDRAGIKNNEWKIGNHGTAIAEDNWDELAKFAVAETPEIPSENPSKDSRYVNKPFWLFRPYIGGIATILTWLFLLLVGGFYFPYLAWTNPFVSWLTPTVIFLFLAIGFSVHQLQRFGASIEETDRLNLADTRLFKWAFVILTVCVAATAPLIYTGYWTHLGCADWFRSLSVGGYLIILGKALTKV